VGLVEVEAQAAGAEPALKGGLCALARGARVGTLHEELEVHGVVLAVHVRHAAVSGRQDAPGGVALGPVVVGVDVEGGADDDLHVAQLGVVAELLDWGRGSRVALLPVASGLEELLQVVKDALHLAVILRGLAHHVVDKPETRTLGDGEVLEAVDALHGRGHAAHVAGLQRSTASLPETEELGPELQDLRKVRLVETELPCELCIVSWLLLQLIERALQVLLAHEIPAAGGAGSSVPS